MPLVIRLHPRYKQRSSLIFDIVVIDSKRSVKSNACLDYLGFFNRYQGIISLNFYKLFRWLSRGSLLSTRFYKLLFFNFFC